MTVADLPPTVWVLIGVVIGVLVFMFVAILSVAAAGDRDHDEWRSLALALQIYPFLWKWRAGRQRMGHDVCLSFSLGPVFLGVQWKEADPLSDLIQNDELASKALAGLVDNVKGEGVDVKEQDAPGGHAPDAKAYPEGGPE